MSKTKATLLGVLLLLIAAPAFGTQYLTPDDALTPIWLTGDGLYNPRTEQWYNTTPKIDTMYDPPAGTRTVWNTGYFIMGTNRYYLDILADAETPTSDSIDFWIRLYNSWDKRNWWVADSVQRKALTVNMSYLLDSLDGAYGAWAYVKISDSLTTLDTMFIGIVARGFESMVLP